jgi:chemotaxis-related protein WspD
MMDQLCCKTIGVFGDGSCERLGELIHCRNCPEYARAGRRLFDRPQSRQEQDQWTELLSREKEVEPAGTVSAVVFKAAGEWFALRTAFLQEITDLRPVHSVPYRSGEIFRGLANINGELLLCVDPAPVMGLAPQPSTFRRMIVAVKDGHRFALLVEDLRGVHRIAPAAITRPPATVAKSPVALAAGLFALDATPVGLLDEQLFFEALAGSMPR